MNLSEFTQKPYDPPFHEPEEPTTFHCDFCGDDVPEYDRVKSVDCLLCSDCINEYCKGKADNSSIITSFIKTKEQEYYLNFYFKGLEDNEKLALIKSMYAIHSKDVAGKKDTYFEEFEKEFCLEEDSFFDYIREGF